MIIRSQFEKWLNSRSKENDSQTIWISVRTFILFSNFKNMDIFGAREERHEKYWQVSDLSKNPAIFEIGSAKSTIHMIFDRYIHASDFYRTFGLLQISISFQGFKHFAIGLVFSRASCQIFVTIGTCFQYHRFSTINSTVFLPNIMMQTIYSNKHLK